MTQLRCPAGLISSVASTSGDPPGRLGWAVAGVLAVLASYYTPEYAKYFRENFFRLPGGGEATNTDQKKTFAEAWNTFGLFPPGTHVVEGQISQPARPDDQ